MNAAARSSIMQAGSMGMNTSRPSIVSQRGLDEMDGLPHRDDEPGHAALGEREHLLLVPDCEHAAP
jgi:hypothetical protein